jgi:hypothetical protein
MLPQHSLADLQGVFAFRAGVDEKSQQLRVRKRLRTEAEQAFTRAVVLRDVVDAVGHDDRSRQGL